MTSDVAVVRGAFGTFMSGREATSEERAELMKPWFHPDVEYAEDESWPGSSTYRGVDEVRRAFEGYAEILGGKVAVEEIVNGADGVFARVHFSGTSTGADVPWEQSWGYHCRVSDGKLAYFKAYADPEQARSDAGVEGS